MTEPRHTHSRIYVHGIDAPQKKEKNSNRAMVYFPPESGMVTSENGDSRTEKPRYDVPQELVSKTGTRLS